MTKHKLQPQVDELRKDVMQLQDIVVTLANQLHELILSLDNGRDETPSD